MLSTQIKAANGIRQGKMPEGGNCNIQTTTIIPDPVDSLGELGKAKWIQIATILVKRGTWSLDWLPALEHICREYDNLSYLDEVLNEPGQTMLVASAGGFACKMNPLFEYRLKTEALIQAMLGQFGLTPISAKGIYSQDDSQRDKQRAAVRTKLDIEENPFDN